MRLVRSLSGMALIFLGGLASVASASEFMLSRQVWGDVIVTTDTSDAGRALKQPTRQQPVYYRGRSLGCRLGSTPGDSEPDVKQLDLLVAGILAKQGYLPAPPSAPDPDLYVVLQWGYVHPKSENLLWFLGYNPADDIAAPVFPDRPGPEVWLRGARSLAIENILEAAQEPIYGIIVTAFDAKTLRAPEPLVYWQTRIGLPAHGKSMAQALPVMFTAAASAIGRPMDKPMLVDADNTRDVRVKLGELKVIDYPSEPPRASEPEGEKH